ncbi:hypothetical protein J5J10_06770 [Ciceribacter sp. L1K23]|uniref:hypothetical protein n=1 Tax=Ciceribacter sp. L1K23 TaxID=2820276 RepID=UPI001B813614|nr:hypothetical protein [Ciceribacter sp. L1K23]MBR0555380.1 hypothetical protein [Ciceribacter sp. L1K23]
MRKNFSFLSIALGILIVAATAFAVVPSFQDDPITTQQTVDGLSSASAEITSPVVTSTYSLHPSDGSAGRPTATFPAFAARGGGIYATDAMEAR